MTPLTVGFIGIGILFILLFSPIPLGVVLAPVVFAGFAFLPGFGASLGIFD